MSHPLGEARPPRRGKLGQRLTPPHQAHSDHPGARWRSVSDGDDLARDDSARALDLTVGRKQSSAVPFCGGDVDGVGVAKRPLRECPGPMHIGPRGGLDDDLESLGRLKGFNQVFRLQRVTWPFRGGSEPGHDLEGEVTGGDERLGGLQIGQRRTCCYAARASVSNRVDDQ